MNAASVAADFVIAISFPHADSARSDERKHRRFQSARWYGAYASGSIIGIAERRGRPTARTSNTARRMWEIAENLHRVELTAQKRSEQIADWINLQKETGEKRRQSAQIEPIESKRADGRGARQAAGGEAAGDGGAGGDGESPPLTPW
jgi:hypothetical protein